MQQRVGFFQSLFDFSFTHFITVRLIKIIYGLSMAVLALYVLFLVVVAFRESSAVGVLALLIGAPLMFLLGVIYTRVILELIIVAFRIAENTGELARRERERSGTEPLDQSPTW